MNVIKFSLEISKKKFKVTDNSIKKYIVNQYSKSVNFGKDLKYCEKVREEWSNIPYKNIKSLYLPKHIIALGYNNKTKYYMFNENNEELLDNNEIDIDVLIICNNNMNASINFVIKHIRKIISDAKVNVIKDENIGIYRTNEDDNDIEINRTIIASFSPTFKWYLPEIAQIVLITIVSIILLISAFNDKSQNSGDIKNLLVGMGASGLIAELSQFAIRIFEMIRREERIEITDLNSFINNEFSGLFSNQDDANKLINPQNFNNNSSLNNENSELEKRDILQNPK